MREYWDRICKLERYGFIFSQDNTRILKVPGIGTHIDMFEAQEVVSDAQDEINELRRQIEMLEDKLR